MLCEFKTLGLKCYFECDIPPLCALELLRTLRMKLYSKPLDVDWVQTSCEFLAGIEMYVLRDMIKNNRYYFKKMRNLATEWRWNNNNFFGGEGGGGMIFPSSSATEFPSLMATDFYFCRCPCPANFPRPKKYVAISIADSVVNNDGILKFRRQVVSGKQKSDGRNLSPILSLMWKFRCWFHPWFRLYLIFQNFYQFLPISFKISYKEIPHIYVSC